MSMCVQVTNLLLLNSISQAHQTNTFLSKEYFHLFLNQMPVVTNLHQQRAKGKSELLLLPLLVVYRISVLNMLNQVEQFVVAVNKK